jgi:hypothetical protein
MTRAEAAEKIVDNASLQAVSRISMIVTPVLIVVVGGLFSIWINGIAADASAAADTSATLQVRVKVLEDGQTVGRTDRIRYQDQVLAQLVKLTDKVDNQASQIAALTATLEAFKSRPR